MTTYKSDWVTRYNLLAVGENGVASANVACSYMASYRWGLQIDQIVIKDADNFRRWFQAEYMLGVSCNFVNVEFNWKKDVMNRNGVDGDISSFEPPRFCKASFNVEGPVQKKCSQIVLEPRVKTVLINGDLIDRVITFRIHLEEMKKKTIKAIREEEERGTPVPDYEIEIYFSLLKLT